jgi:hypothetical protein
MVYWLGFLRISGILRGVRGKFPVHPGNRGELAIPFGIPSAQHAACLGKCAAADEKTGWINPGNIFLI